MGQVPLAGWLLILLLWVQPLVAAPKQQYLIALPININESDALTLSRAMVGVGPVKAAAIVEYRALNGPFSRVEDLLEVKGIGNGTLSRNKGRISVK